MIDHFLKQLVSSKQKEKCGPYFCTFPGIYKSFSGERLFGILRVGIHMTFNIHNIVI